MSDEAVTLTSEPTAAEAPAEFTFDLALISLDELMDVFDIFFAAQEGNSSNDPAAYRKMFHAVRKTLVAGSRPLTGADLQPVIEGFAQSVLGGDSQKN